jgi:hypothetical protein
VHGNQSIPKKRPKSSGWRRSRRSRRPPSPARSGASPATTTTRT